MNTRPNSAIVLPIQYLRGIAAVMVVWHHIKGQIPNFESVLPGAFGASGVDLFFVISGFIMYITTANTAIRPAEFMVRRIIRVVPLYWILTMAMVCGWLLAPSLFKTLIVTPLTLLESLFFVPHFSKSFPGHIYPLLVPGWTLNYEMFFYALFALTLFFKAPARSTILSAVMAGLVCAGVFWGPFAPATVITYTSPLLLEFVAGVLLGHLWIARGNGIHFGLGILLFAAGWAMLISHGVFANHKYNTILGAVLIVAGSINSTFLKWNNNSLRVLGDSTYSLYLTHIFTLGITRAIWVKCFGDGGSNFNAFSFAFASMLLCLFVGLMTYFFLERQITQYLNTKIFKPNKRSMPTRIDAN